MRAWEFIGEGNQPPSNPITLRSLNKLKIRARQKSAEDQQRFALMPLIYGNSEHIKDQLDIQRQKLEIQQLEMQIRKEQDSETYDAISAMAKSGIDAADENKKKLAGMAKSGLGRSRKL